MCAGRGPSASRRTCRPRPAPALQADPSCPPRPGAAWPHLMCSRPSREAPHLSPLCGVDVVRHRFASWGDFPFRMRCARWAWCGSDIAHTGKRFVGELAGEGPSDHVLLVGRRGSPPAPPPPPRPRGDVWGDAVGEAVYLPERTESCCSRRARPSSSLPWRNLSFCESM
jgi:hypothetical protein